jgi:hypothetical protein
MNSQRFKSFGVWRCVVCRVFPHFSMPSFSGQALQEAFVIRINSLFELFDRREHYDPSTLREIFAQRHCVTSQKTRIFRTRQWETLISPTKIRKSIFQIKSKPLQLGISVDHKRRVTLCSDPISYLTHLSPIILKARGYFARPQCSLLQPIKTLQNLAIAWTPVTAVSVHDDMMWWQ